MEAPFLTSVRVACSAEPRFDALTHVPQLVNSFLDPSPRLPLCRVVRLGSRRLFSRVLSCVESDPKRLRLERLQQFRLAMKAAAQVGELWMVQQLSERHPGALNAAATFAAAESGSLPLLQWICQHKPVLMSVDYYAATHKAFKTAATRGDMQTVQWVVRVFSRVKYDLGVPARAGHLALVQWVHANAKCTFDPSAVFDAVVNGGLDMFLYLYEHNLVAVYTGVADLAAENGHLGLVQWLHAHRIRFSEKAIDSAAANGHLDVIQWLYENGKTSCTTAAMDKAAGAGHLHVVRWLHVHECGGCTSEAMDEAAKNGHLEVVQWLHTNRHEGCTTSAMDQAATMNHLKVVQWLHENRKEGCTTEAMDQAASAGHLDVVKWLHHNRREGCTTSAMDHAAGNGHLDTVKFLHAKRKEGCSHLALNTTASEGDLEMVQWLFAHRSEGVVPQALECAAANGHLHVVKYLHTCSANCSSRVIQAAASNGHLNVAQWLHDNCVKRCPSVALVGAAKKGSVKTVRWLYEHGSEACPSYLMLQAFASGNFEMLEFMRANNIELPDHAKSVASRNDQIEVLQWLAEHYIYSEVR